MHSSYLVKLFAVLVVFLKMNLFEAKSFNIFRSFLSKFKYSDENCGGRVKSIPTFLFNCRGGSSVILQESESHVPDGFTVIVSTNVGSSFLDKKKKIVVAKNTTIRDIKAQLQQKFPGSPPMAIQRLFYGLRKLEDHEILGNLTNSNVPLPLVLDVITGTSSYNKTLTVSQALEAYASLSVHQSYLGQQFRTIFEQQQQHDGNQSETMSISLYQDILDSINSSIYNKYSEDIYDALDREMEPEVLTADTAAWRRPGVSGKKPLAIVLAKEFDLNARVFRFFIYYSVLLGFFAIFGTSSSISKNLMLLGVPVLWAFRLRQLRLISKICLYLVLPIMPTLDFLMPLLPAPYQVIAQQSKLWLNKIDENEAVTEESQNLISSNGNDDADDEVVMEGGEDDELEPLELANEYDNGDDDDDDTDYNEDN